MTSRTGIRANAIAIVAVAAFAFVVAACSGAAASAAPTAAGGAGGSKLAVAAASGSVGAYLTGPNGMTLYTLNTDTANTTTCTAACATTWPPFTVNAGDTFTPGAGVTGTLASYARPDGATQATLNGQPLYYYSGDTKAGDTTGNGKGGKWYVASPTGMAPASAGPSASASGYSY